MKSLKTRLLDRATLELFQQAHHRASLGKAHRSEVLRFNLNEQNNLLHIVDVVRRGEYQPSQYRKFWVFDPKKREIAALPYPDRIVHQWAVEEFYKPYYYPRFIGDSYACIDGRGTHRAVKRAQAMMRRMDRSTNGAYYIVKLDISKYFNNINQQILFDLMQRVIADPALVDLTGTFIFGNDNQIGIPIGNYTSQLFANIYLNELDQFVKNVLRVVCYVRYMDDFVMMVPGKATAAYVYSRVEEFLHDRLALRLNPKSRYYPGTMGLDFAGYRIYNDYLLLRRRSKKKLIDIIRDYQRGRDDQTRFVMRINSWHGHASHADAYRYTRCHLTGYRDILPVVFPPAKASSISA